MKTTNLFAEIVIIGGETLAWIAILISAIMSLSLSEALKFLSEPSIWIPGLIASYIVGVFVDSSANELLFRNIKNRIRANIIRKRVSIDLDDNQCRKVWRDVRSAAVAMPENLKGATDLAYIRHRIRILRGTSINSPLIAGAGTIFLWRADFGFLWFSGTLGLGLAISFACYIVSRRLEQSWSTLSYDWYTLYTSQQNAKASAQS